MKEGRVKETMKRMTAEIQGAQLFKQELLSKGRYETNNSHTDIYTQTPLSSKDATRAWKGNTVGIAGVWKKHFFFCCDRQNLACAIKRRGGYCFFLPCLFSSDSFFTVSLLALLCAVLNAGQVQRAHRPSLLETQKAKWMRKGGVFANQQLKPITPAPPTRLHRVDLTQVGANNCQSQYSITLPWHISKC